MLARHAHAPIASKLRCASGTVRTNKRTGLNSCGFRRSIHFCVVGHVFEEAGRLL